MSYVVPFIHLLEKIYAVEDMRITPQEKQLKVLLAEAKKRIDEYRARETMLEKRQQLVSYDGDL